MYTTHSHTHPVTMRSAWEFTYDYDDIEGIKLVVIDSTRWIPSIIVNKGQTAPFDVVMSMFSLVLGKSSNKYYSNICNIQTFFIQYSKKYIRYVRINKYFHHNIDNEKN